MKRIELIGSAFRREALLGPTTGALSRWGIRVALLAMVLAGMALWSTAASADGEEAGEPVWSADMTVVEYTSVSIGAASADLFSNVGGSGNLQIKSLWSHVPDRDLRLAFADEVPNAGDYTLQVGDLSLEFPADSSGASSFKWQDVDVDWEDGQLIRVRIVLTSEIAAPQANTPATGVPTISGTAQVGETLAADTSGIADEDGLDSVSYHYQWMRTDTDIADATDSTYTLTDNDQGKTVKLKVSFIDDNGNSETLTSAATAEVSKRPQFLVSNLGVGIEGAGGIQRTLSAARSGFAQAFTTGAKTDGYAVGAVDIQVSHFFDASNTADQLRVTINGVASEDEPGDAHCTLTNPSSFTALSVITFEAPTGAGSCPQLAAETTYFVVIEWTSPTGTDSFAVIPQTYPTKESAAIAEDPGGAEGWSIADQAYYLSVISNARTWTEYDEMASFKIKVEEGAAIAAKANSPATGVPTISGTVQVGETLTGDTSGIADEDGIDDVEFSYQWLADDTDIDGATDSTYTLTDADQGKTIKVTVSFADDAENEETLTSAATAAVTAKANSPATGLLTITGTPQVGQTLTADTSAIEDADGLEDVSYEYQWIAGGTDIDGATSSSYELTSSEQGQTIQVRVTFTDDAENEETLTSAATEAVATAPNHPATGAPTITGTPQVDHTLTAGISPIADEDGLDNVSYSYQWISGGSDIDGATGSTYTLTASEQGQTIQVRVTFTDDADNEETLTSMATTAVAAQPTSLLTASFANVPADHDGSNFTFDLNFSENVNAGYARIRDDAFTVSGGAIASAIRKTQGSNQGWTVEVDPEGNGSVSITLPETTDCDASGAICTDDSRKLSQSTSATVAGPPAISVSDATVQEAEGAVLVFTATLSHASSRTVTVDYATSNGTAVAGSDYTAASGTLTFNAGDTSQTVQVTVLTDSEDESQQTLTLTLSNPSQATLDDATGAGAIENGESSSGTQEDPPAEDPPAVLLTASFGNMPATHNGSAFTFDLTFSEEFGISYVTLRDDAFSVTDGEVTSARRLTQGSNIGWTITVTPDSAADVTIVLPVTTDCDDEGAVCTEDGRKLSNRLEFTVSGPSG